MHWPIPVTPVKSAIRVVFLYLAPKTTCSEIYLAEHPLSNTVKRDALRLVHDYVTQTRTAFQNYLVTHNPAKFLG